MKLIDKWFGTRSQREIKRLQPIIEKIHSYEPRFEKLADEELKNKTVEFKERYKNGESLDAILPEAFALVKEATKRTLGTPHYDEQLLGGIILHQGRITEMRTGEGKTQTIALAAYLNALTGEGVHVVTVNDYLALRDSEWIGPIYELLGLSVGCILNSMDNDERRIAYAKDITYGTNNEFGFDYLRDNMVIYKEKLVMRDLSFAIIDEVDSILIDEARTPLIISGQSGKSTKLYQTCDILACQLKRGTEKELSKMDVIMGEQSAETGDFIVNEKDKNVHLTEEGVRKVEQFFQIDNLADAENYDIQHNIILALRAHNLMFKDKDYVVQDNQIMIVDDFTGRILPGRRFSDGLHQAIEAKEHVEVKRESKTLATITFQNFFNKYNKKCGLTGTALTEEREFREIYGMDVIEVPTHLPIARKDLNDIVFKSKREKLNAIVQEIIATHEKGQPVLVGTITIEASEELSMLLKRQGIPHRVLNAKYHALEAEIIADAGQKGAVTIATNMAGRGTDIKLGEGVVELGGLKIIGTERHESRRIDNQLRGRAGRQGDPGESKFYISLEDKMMRLFAPERMISMFNMLGMPEGQPLEHKMLSSAVERAQKKIENNHFGVRKSLLEYDQVNNEQRELIYSERRKVLDGLNMRPSIINMMMEVATQCVDSVINEDMNPSDWDLNELNELLIPIFGMDRIEFKPEQLKNMRKNMLIQQIKETLVRLYEERESLFPSEEVVRELERIILLRTIDRKWMAHIDDMEQLRTGIGLQAYGQRNPVIEYKLAGYDMFEEMEASIAEETVKTLMHVSVERKMEREEVAKITGTNHTDSSVAEPVRRTQKKIMPNDKCPCGSGKKYKFCCGKDEK